ncbi:hypothetical protein [Aestuariivirga sp.]|uniref:hypothetical protein n=1 Tax=Aestuariivirga sp. TaxID=2650926 RepID=UPI003BA907C9
MEHGKDKRPDQLMEIYGADVSRWPEAERALKDASPSLVVEAREIDLVLALATDPPLPAGAAARLMARIEAEPQGAEVIAFTPRSRPKAPVWRFATALPLAASLALGVYLGAQGTLDFMLPSAITGGIAWNDDGQIDDLGGVGDADAYAHAQDSTT